MSKRLILFLTIAPLLFTATFASKDDKVAKVIIVRGTVTATEINGDTYPIEKGVWLKEGTALESKSKSFVKLLFIDKSQMSLGPESKMKITAFPKNKAGILTLMKGQLRSKVTKDYMGIKNKNKSKLFIKTKTAAMGVRGTHFQVNYNPINQVTSLVTFEGAVAMAQLNDAIKKVMANQVALEKMVSSDQAVIVKRGQYSGANPKQFRVTSPVKINPAQLKVMEKNEGENIQTPDQSKNRRKPKARKKFRSTIPPGVDAQAFSNDSDALDQSMESSVGKKEAKKVLQKVRVLREEVKTAADAAGNVNYITGEVTPPAGGYVDTNTGLYVPPPPGSAYDAQTETFIPPPNYGGFDPDTGDYVNDSFELTEDGVFVALPEEGLPERGPASEEDGNDEGDPLAGDPNQPPPPEMTPPPFGACDSAANCELPPPPEGTEGPGGLPPPEFTPPPEGPCEVTGTCPPPPNGAGKNVQFIFN
jgi:hypothetical protein